MQLIPVIDLKDGVVVHAKLGLRNHYLPLRSPLCSSSAVDDVMTAFLTLHPFQTFYIADLNAITANGDHQTLISQLLKKHPKRHFWVDSGYQAQPNTLFTFPNYHAVLGSESYPDDKLAALSHFGKKFILSLDFSSQHALGSARLFCDERLWPPQIIVMTLARVGSNAGVDIEKLLYYQGLTKDKTVIAAGGIRNKYDVLALQKIGIRAALCASALHNGAITPSDFVDF